MTSLRHVRGQNLAEQNRVRSLARKGATLAGTSEEELLERVENALRKSQIRLHDLEGDRGQTELALWFLCSVLEPHRNVIKELSVLLGFTEEDFLTWPSVGAREALERVKKHGCPKCQWLDEKLCLQSEGEENFPEECPGKELVALAKAK